MEEPSGPLLYLAQQHTKLTYRAGAWWGRCPFHVEETPSFRAEREGWYCYGCKRGGDVAAFERALKEREA